MSGTLTKVVKIEYSNQTPAQEVMHEREKNKSMREKCPQKRDNHKVRTRSQAGD